MVGYSYSELFGRSHKDPTIFGREDELFCTNTLTLVEKLAKRAFPKSFICDEPYKKQ